MNDQVQKKQDEQMRLQWEISDLETQLEALQRTTRDVCESSATVGTAVSWTQANLDKLAAEVNELKGEDFDKAAREFDEVEAMDAEGKILC